MKKRTGYLTKIFATFVTLLTIVGMCTGCTNFQNKEAIVESVNNCIPGVKDFTVEDKVLPSGDSATVYTFETDNFSFDFYETTVGVEGGSFTTTMKHTDYYQKLFEFKADDINDIASRTGIKLIDAKLTQEHIDGSNCYVYIKYENSGAVTFYLYVNDSSQIKAAFDFLNGVWENLKDFVPTQEGVCTHEMHINLYNVKYDTLVSQQKQNMWGEIDLSEHSAWATYEYEADVLDGFIEDKTVDVKNVRPRTINRVYYNEGLLSDLETDTTFYYNPIDGQYYVLVCYGVEKNFDTSHPGYLHKEILETIYANISYKIVDSFKEKSSTYVIDGDEFCIEWSKRDTSKGELIFHKNGTILDIKTYKNLGPISGQSTDNRFISAVDFAKLMNLNVTIYGNTIKFSK